jgi:malate synthase
MKQAGDFAIDAPAVPGQDSILTPEALDFLAGIERRFGAHRRELMEARKKLQQKLDDGGTLDFLPETAAIRAADWKVRPAPPDLQDRRVEITGPPDRKMVINALNSGASVFMADFEDSNTPTWANLIAGQINLRDANLRKIDFTDAASGKTYRLNDKPAVLMARPRGLHMEEEHLKLDGAFISASFFDFALYAFHNKTAPLYFYLPKMENHLEARLWSDVLKHAEDALGLERGTMRVTVLIETIPASFQMDEILHELKDHIAGLNCGRWDYIFNFIKRFAAQKHYIMPDRDQVTMAAPFLRAYSLDLVRICHRRGCHAMGGMAAQIPIKGDEEANKKAFEKVAADKQREALAGHDGTWVAHPGLVRTAKDIFDRIMPEANQINRPSHTTPAAAQDLLSPPSGFITEEGIRRNVRVGLLYLKSWLSGQGCVPIDNLMEDAATAEISRTQLWQWRHHNVRLKAGRIVDDRLMAEFLKEEADKLRGDAPDKYLEDAKSLFHDLVMADHLEEFLTTKAYDMILGYEKAHGH